MKIVKTSQLSELTAVQAQTQLAHVFELVKRAKTLDEIRQIEDGKLQMEAFLRTRRAAIAMGDEMESLRAKLRELTLEVELQQGEILKQMAAPEKVAALEEFGISKATAARCELAAGLPTKTIDAIKTIQKRKGLDVTARDLAPLAALKPQERKLVAAQLGDVRGVRDAIEKAKALPDWKPSAPNKKIAEPLIESGIVEAAEYAGRANELRLSVNILVAHAERYVANRTPALSSLVRQAQQVVTEKIAHLGDPTKSSHK